MKTLALIGVGVTLGFLLATRLRAPSDCCHTVAQLVRGKVASEYGDGIAGLGDLFGVWDWTPGLVGFLQPKGQA